MCRSILFLLFSFLFFYEVEGQSQYTLQQCIDRALQYNIQIKQSSLSNDLNKIQVTQSAAALLPNVSGNASQNYYYGRSIDPYTNTYTTQQVQSNSFSLSSNLTLFEGMQLQNTLKESKLNYLSSQNELKKIQNDIKLNVVNSFLQVLYNEELKNNSKSRIDASTIQRDKMKRMFELGSVNKGNYLELEAQVASDDVTYVQAQSQYEQSLLSLAQLLELDTIKDFSIVRPEFSVPGIDSSIFNVDLIYNTALSSQPDIKSADYKVSSAEKGLASAKGGLYPRLYLGGSINTNYSNSSKDVSFIELAPIASPTGFTASGETVYTLIPNSRTVIKDIPFKDQWDNNLGKSIGVSLQLPIFNGWTVHSNISRARINLEQSRLNSELTRKNLFKSIQVAVSDAIAAQKKFNAGKLSVDAMQELYNYNNRRLELGLVNTYDYLLAKNNLANAQTSLLQAKYDYIFRIKVLDFYMGKPLSF